VAELEAEAQGGVGLEDFFRVLRERWWVIVVTVAVVVAAVAAWSLTTTPIYRATTDLVFERSRLDTALLGVQLFTYESDQTRNIQTAMAAVTRNKSIAEGVQVQLNSQKSPHELAEMVTATAERNTNVVSISAESPDPGEAAAVANAFADQFILYRQRAARATVIAAREVIQAQVNSLSPTDLQSDYGLMLQEKLETLRILESMQTGDFNVLSRAEVPTSPVVPQTERNLVLAVVVGLLVGVGLAFLADRLDKRIKNERMLETEMGVPVLAAVPAVEKLPRRGKKANRSSRPVGFSGHPLLLESFRTLRSSLQYFSVDKRHHVWLVTSGLPEEGKTTVTVNLALSFALSGKKVILVEADLRRPLIHDYLGLEQSQGLSNVLAGTKKAPDVLQLVRADEFLPPESRRQPGEVDPRLLQRNLYAITSGPLPPNPAELLASERMGHLLHELAQLADEVIIDTPPVLLVSDALVLAPYADGVIVTARMLATTWTEVREVRTLFERAELKVVGTVAVGTKHGPGYYRRGYGRYGYAYGYGYGHPVKK